MNHSAELKLIQAGPLPEGAAAVRINNLHAWFGDAHVLQGIDVDFYENRINCIVGPSGSGKSTLIRSINRMNDDIPGYRVSGSITIDGQNVLAKTVDVTRLRTGVGMVFQKPCVFPKSIVENVLFGLKHHRKLSRAEQLHVAEKTLKSVSLWNEVAHRLHDKATGLSLGQQQRLCFARALAIQPRILLLDEPTASLDPVSARAIEALMRQLKKDYTIVFVTHNIQQARRVADQLIFMCDGKIIEQGPAQQLFTHPRQPQTRQYLNEEYCDC